jgi:hypothetical protein
LFGVSLAGFNLLASLIMLGCCVVAWLHARGMLWHRRADDEIPRGAA